jgi:hypothetical protein
MRHRLSTGLFYPTLLLAVLTWFFATERPGLAASDINLDPNILTQSLFRDLSEEAGLAISYTAAAPAEPLGFPHFDVGVETSVTQIHSNATYWQAAFYNNGTPPRVLPLPKLRARVGLPFGIDLGGNYAYLPGTNISMAGGEIKWAPYKGGIIMPAVAIRGTYTTLLGVSDLSIQTFGADLSISKGFAIFTPYLGVGQIWIKSKVTSSDPSIVALNIRPETISRTRGFVGLQIGIPLIRFVAEAAFSAIPTYTARLSVGF